MALAICNLRPCVNSVSEETLSCIPTDAMVLNYSRVGTYGCHYVQILPYSREYLSMKHGPCIYGRGTYLDDLVQKVSTPAPHSPLHSSFTTDYNERVRDNDNNNINNKVDKIIKET